MSINDNIENSYPQNFDFWMNKGDELEQQEKPDEALQAFRKAAEIDPLNHWAWQGIGSAFAKMDKRDEAIEAFDHAIYLAPDNSAPLHNKAVYFQNYGYEDGDTVQAIKLYRKALQLNENNDSSWWQLAFLLLEEENYIEALDAFGHAIDLYEKDVKSTEGRYVDDLAMLWDGKAKTLAGLNRDKEALEAFDKAAAIDEYSFDEDSFICKGTLLLGRGNAEEALLVYSRGTERFPEEAALWQNMAVILAGLRRYEEACEASDKAIGLDSEDFELLANKAFFLNSLDRKSDALAVCQQALKIQEVPYLLYYSGKLLRELGRLEEAFDAFNKFSMRSPELAQYWHPEEIVLTDTERTIEALQAYEKAIGEELWLWACADEKNSCATDSPLSE